MTGTPGRAIEYSDVQITILARLLTVVDDQPDDQPGVGGSTAPAEGHMRQLSAPPSANR